MKEKIGQHLIIGLKGPQLTDEETQFIIKHNIGGVILFSRNVESLDQLCQLCLNIQSLRHRLPDKQPLFISIDMEGGRVARLKAPFTLWPEAAKIGALGSSSVAFKFSNMMAKELRSVGLNLDYAPCVDVLTNPKNTVIGDRSLGSDPNLVAKLSSALVRGYIKGGIIPCAKHFPGHGGTLIDSHEDLPVEQLELKELNDVPLVPFKKTFKAGLNFVMTAHVKFPKIDPHFPVTLSKIFLQDILRQHLRFRNLVITDDLGMGALVKYYDKKEIPILALNAGCDVLLFCNDFEQPKTSLEAVYKAIENKQLNEQQLNEGYNKIITIKKELLSQPDPLPMAEASKLVGHPDHLRLAKAIAEGEVPKNLIEA